MIQAKDIVVMGVSNNKNRSSYIATELLNKRGYHIHAFGAKESKSADIEIKKDVEKLQNVDAVSIFYSPEKQIEYYDYIIELDPKRIIFNPGTENPELEKIAEKNKIEVVKGCTIAMLCFGML